jgi:putative FmdB family regulatory protein
MPRYDYKCKQCGYETEHQHSFKEEPEFKCPDCEDSVLVKFFTNLNFSIRNTTLKRRLKEQYEKETDMRQDLRENHLVEKVAPVAAQTIEQVHKEVKAAGSAVKDKMQQQIALGEEKSLRKRREWAKDANKRVKKRTLEKRERDAAEAAQKRKITVSTKK